jgi:hypothetical protein
VQHTCLTRQTKNFVEVAADGAQAALQTVISGHVAAAPALRDELASTAAREGVDASGWFATTAPSAGTLEKLGLIEARVPVRGETAERAHR